MYIHAPAQLLRYMKKSWWGQTVYAHVHRLDCMQPIIVLDQLRQGFLHHNRDYIIQIRFQTHPSALLFNAHLSRADYMASRGGRGGAEKGGLSWRYLPVRLDPVSYLDDFRRHILPPTFPDWEPDIVEASPMELGQLYMVP